MKKQIINSISLLCALAICGVLRAQVPSYVPTDSLVAWWPFNGNANDESGNNHHATETDAQFIPNGAQDRFGNNNGALLFDGQNDFLEIPHHIDFNSLPITFSFWMKTDGYSTQQMVLNKYCCSNWDGWNVQFGFFGGQDSWEFAYFRGGCQGIFQTYCNPQPFPISNGFDNVWHNYVFVVDTTGSTVYKDGSIFLEQDWFFNGANPSSVITPITNSLPINIGRYGAGNELFYSGILDDIAIWNRALTQEEVLSLFGPSVSVFNDLDGNCFSNEGFSPVSSAQISIEPGGLVALTQPNGIAFINSEVMPDGSYTASIITENTDWIANCGQEINFSVSSGEMSVFPVFAVTNTNPCPSPDISIICPTIRRCSEHTWPIYVHACNNYSGTGVLDSAYVLVQLDENIIVDPATTPPYTMENGLYRFELGNINPGQCIDLVINANFSCDLELGETLCMEATLYPVPECLQDTVPVPGPCELPWDQSSLSVNGWCDQNSDSIYFTVSNGGEAMDCYSEVRVYVDGVLYATYYIQLDAESDTTFAFPATGQTWILQADQHPLHPGNSHPNDHVEGCGGNADWTPGLVDDLPAGDESPFTDEFCGQVVGSFDPNDKQGFPDGIGEYHEILPNGQMQYLIRFQNTGTAPAYTVVIRDTLDINLDIFSVTPGASSHDYSFTMYGERVLQWTFNNIMLPDSFSNEEQSHGFITYTVNQMNDLEDGTIINNSAAIYFDSNEPVITNTTLHTINHCVFSETQSAIDVNAVNEYVAPDGQLYDQSGTYTAVIMNDEGCDSTITINLTITVGVLELNNPGLRVFPIPASQTLTAVWDGDSAPFEVSSPDGRVVLSGRLLPGTNNVDISSLSSGAYFLKADNRVTRFVVK